MKIFYSPYTLIPKKRLNRVSSMNKKQGVFLKAELKNKTYFADYFPHEPLGDRHCDQFLTEFKFQKEEYDKKVFDLLLKDHEFQNIIPKTFFNHQLWSSGENIQAKTIKYKLQDSQDKKFIPFLEQGTRVRLDFNALFSKPEYFKFLKDIPDNLIHLIDYAEDPLKETDWADLKIPTARDFIQGDPFEYYIYKPNSEFYPETQAKIIFSSYLGSDLGRYQSYCELLNRGDLSLIHGIATFDYYEEERPIFKGNYGNGFVSDKVIVRKLYKSLSDYNWKTLCSM
jgi:hypothetical protein